MTTETGTEPRRDLRLLPKAELHVHLLGALRETTLRELSALAGLPPANPQAFTTFAQFQQMFQAAYDAVKTHREHLERLVREVVADAAADGAVWVQPHFDPHIFPAFGTPDEVLRLVLAAGEDEGGRRGVGFGLTIGAMRHLGPDRTEELARFAARHAGHGVYAFGLTGDEVAYPPEPFAAAFALARSAGLAAAPHAGELAGPDSVRAAVEALGATRIAHGVGAADDPRLLRELVDRDVTLDVCLTSNLRLGVVGAMTEHPLPRLLAAGVPCTLGADDPLMFGVGLLDEYEVARDQLGLTDEQLARIARRSVERCGAPAGLVAAWTAEVRDWLAGPGQPPARRQLCVS
ncbi:putative adenosine/adenine deaminase [Catellatospora sp. TT07R-123]|uniref:adenosine deaminase n=1 Tax=Catellatospora sp. TT07R-123 TaxID=2733863 RepID=UPI001B016EF7|nr:adenosine deaminase [Catellatospora sp. TT07R-123]GHJ43500.1 putative adenosine/adenine deaminase [Catellatospora sp. TT07R-123]